jgi:FAD synthetase
VAYETNRPGELSLSYNGGKDCLVLLILILACLPGPISSPFPSTSTDGAETTDPTSAERQLSTAEPELLQAIYIAPRDPFPEVEEFVATSTKQYHLDLRRYSVPMRPALEAYLRDRPAVKAIFLGTRRTDPHSESLTAFSPTDKDWPQFMRVNPVLDWHYVEIWAVSSGSVRNRLGSRMADSFPVHPLPRHSFLQSVPARVLLSRWHDKYAAQSGPCRRL